MAGRARGILEVLEVAFTCLFLVLCRANLVHFVEGHCDGACLAENGNLEETGVDGVGEVGDLLELYKGSVTIMNRVEPQIS